MIAEVHTTCVAEEHAVIAQCKSSGGHVEITESGCQLQGACCCVICAVMLPSVVGGMSAG